MGIVTAKLRETVEHVLDMSVLVLNLRGIQRADARLFALLIAILLPQRKMAIVQ